MQLINRVFKPARSSSRQVAKERLQLVLVHDRTQISPQMLETLKDEIIAVISQHVAIQREGVEITLAQNRRESRLQADIPIVARPTSKSDSRKRANG
jgi:cell division topological specificity factor